MHKINIPTSAKCYYAYEYFKQHKKHVIITCTSEESAMHAYKQMQFIAGEDFTKSVLHYPAPDNMPYDRVSSKSEIVTKRANILSILAASSLPFIIITSAHNLLIKVPDPEIFQESTISISVGMKLNMETLALFLMQNGFVRSASAVMAHEFAMRGEIMDLVTSEDRGYRINFGWENIDSIKQFDTITQISKCKVEKFTLRPCNEIMFKPNIIDNFKRNFLQHFGVNRTSDILYESIVSGKLVGGIESLMPLFYENKMSGFLDVLMQDYTVIYDNFALQSLIQYDRHYREIYQERMESNKIYPETFYHAINPDLLISKSSELTEQLSNKDHIYIQPNDADISDDVLNFGIRPIENINALSKRKKQYVFDTLFELLKKHSQCIPVILCNSTSSINRIKTIAESNEYSVAEVDRLDLLKENHLNLAIAPLNTGFISSLCQDDVTDHSRIGNKNQEIACSNQKQYLFISEQDIFGIKFNTSSHKTSTKRLKNILEELDNFKEGELVVHNDHGIGRFESVETITVHEISHDCLKLVYLDNDILYLPVENIDMIKKYGSNSANLDKLGSASWQRRKAKLKNKIKDIAKKLMTITAKRAICKIEPIIFDLEKYDQFCYEFAYSETEDQLSAINDVREDLISGKLMDRLICGDVGFGKTEVAMRASYMVAFSNNHDRPQVAIITPTTILCKQHYKSFKDRFKNFDLNIVQLSRLVKSAQLKDYKEQIKDGSANIIIGTHALLSKNVEFHNLQLVIIDEEQHFGVLQKEKLKELKAKMHVLSLSATPIPRTLQMSMVGLKDLSLIATPPIDRLPVRTNITPFDPIIIKDALMREHLRGGQSFYVCPRITDIDWIERQLQRFVPELKYKVAHGQMLSSAIDNVMNEFYDKKFDILIATNIIESGIDVTNANTMIIHKPDLFGLSTLYQLRGRVGRAAVQGYVYLSIHNNQALTKATIDRLEILQNINSLGAGFTIATHDMDLRGFGNLVGDEQSGHIKEVGSELYHDMLDSAIDTIKNQELEHGEGEAEQNIEFTASINLGLPVYIPDTYIADSSLRLAIYRRAANLKHYKEVESFTIEMLDRFGKIPHEFQNLLDVVRLKNKALELKIEQLESGPKGFVIKFNKHFDVSKTVMLFVTRHPRNAKIRPDNKLVFIKSLTKVNIVEEAGKLLDAMVECTQASSSNVW